MKKKPKKREYRTIFRAWITLKNGKRLYARACGLKAFPIRIPISNS